MTREEINEWANRNNNALHCLRVMVDEEVCEECGYGSEGEMQHSSEYDVRTNFCPNCGADMREDKE